MKEHVTEPAAAIEPLCAAFVDGLRALLADRLIGVYLYGAVAFPETGDTVQDLDFHVIVAEPLTSAERDGIIALRKRLAEDYPPLGGELDGYVIALADARRTAPPRHQLWPRSHVPRDEAWALHCAHVRAGRHIVLWGPDPLGIYPEPAEGDIAAALEGELRYVAEHLVHDPAYCVLNLCRLIYSYETGDVVTSKQASASWATRTLPEQWHPLIEAAQRSYRRSRVPGDGERLAAGVAAFFAFAQERIAASVAASAPPGQ